LTTAAMTTKMKANSINIYNNNSPLCA